MIFHCFVVYIPYFSVQLYTKKYDSIHSFTRT